MSVNHKIKKVWPESPHSEILSLWHISDKTLADDLLMSSLHLQIFSSTFTVKADMQMCESFMGELNPDLP